MYIEGLMMYSKRWESSQSTDNYYTTDINECRIVEETLEMILDNRR